MELHEYWSSVKSRQTKFRERYGQAAFNHLVRVRPDLAEQVRATPKDPFYITDTKSQRWESFLAFLTENW